MKGIFRLTTFKDVSVVSGCGARKRPSRWFVNRLTIAAIQYALVIGLAFWLGSPVVGAVTVVVALVGLPLT